MRKCAEKLWGPHIGGLYGQVIYEWYSRDWIEINASSEECNANLQFNKYCGFTFRSDFSMKLIDSPHSDCECRHGTIIPAMLTFGKLQFFALKWKWKTNSFCQKRSSFSESSKFCQI